MKAYENYSIIRNLMEAFGLGEHMARLLSIEDLDKVIINWGL